MSLQNPRMEHRDPVALAVIRAEGLTMADLPGFYDRAYGQVTQALAEQGISPAGPALAYYLRVPDETFDVAAGFRVSTPLPQDSATGEVRVGELPGGQVACATHVGGYETLSDSWGAFVEWVTGQGRKPGVVWEIYVTEPSPDMDPATLRTDLCIQLAD